MAVRIAIATHCIALQVPAWLRSEAASMLMDYIQTMNESIKRKPLSTPCPVSDVCLSIRDAVAGRRGRSLVFCDCL